jgi:hypothetical protein
MRRSPGFFIVRLSRATGVVSGCVAPDMMSAAAARVLRSALLSPRRLLTSSLAATALLRRPAPYRCHYADMANSGQRSVADGFVRLSFQQCVTRGLTRAMGRASAQVSDEGRRSA